MMFGKFLATVTIAGTALLGVSAPAFASTQVPGPTPTTTWSPDGHGNGGDGNWNNGGNDNKGCHQGDQRDQWNKNCDPKGGDKCRDNQGRDGNWNSNCDPQGDHGNNCHFPFLTSWDGHGQWSGENQWFSDDNCGRGNDGHGDHNGDNDHGNKNRHHRNHCVNQLVTFNMPHGSSVLTETQGPWLYVNETATYQGQTYTIASVQHTGFFGYDHFTVDDTNGHLVTNNGQSIWHGEAHVLTCTR